MCSKLSFTTIVCPASVVMWSGGCALVVKIIFIQGQGQACAPLAGPFRAHAQINLLYMHIWTLASINTAQLDFWTFTLSLASRFAPPYAHIAGACLSHPLLPPPLRCDAQHHGKPIHTITALQQLRADTGRAVPPEEIATSHRLAEAGTREPAGAHVHLNWAIAHVSYASGYIPATAQETLLQNFLGERRASETATIADRWRI